MPSTGAVLLHTDDAGTAAPEAFGPFRVLHQIGAGTLGPVFRAYDAARERLVAVKLFRLDLPPQRMHRLVEEFEWLIAAELAHPSLVVPIATGTDGIVVYLARDFVAADSLDVAVRDDGPAPPLGAVRVALELADALDLAAAVGVLHGALHPRDVLMSPSETRLTDIGVSQALAKLGVAVPLRRPYSAPEQIAGEAWSRPADVFGLAMLVHELLWGKRPTAIGAEAGKALTQVPGADLEALRAVFARALARDPARRFETAIAFAYELKSAFSEVEVPNRQVDGRTSSELRPATGDRGPRTSKAPRLPLDEPEGKPALERPSQDAIPLLPNGLIATSREAIHPVDHSGIELGLREADRPRYVEVDDGPAAPTRGKAPDRGDAPVVDNPFMRTARGDHDPRAVELRRGGRARSTFGLVAASLVVGIALGFAGGIAVGNRRQAVAFFQLLDGTAASTGAVVGAGDAVPQLPSAQPGVDEASKPAQTPNATAEVVPPPSSPSRGLGEPSTLDTPIAKADTATVRPAPAPPGGFGEPRTPHTTDREVRTREKAGAASVGEELKPGRVLVRSTPAGARVLIDGERQGATPAAVRNLTPGVHRVQVVLEGYVTEERRVTISTAQPAQSVVVELERLRASSAGRDRTTVTPASAAVDAFTGALSIESKPDGAQVFLDGKLRGTTPLEIIRVDAGEHAVRLELDGYRRWSASVRIVTGERNRVTASLER